MRGNNQSGFTLIEMLIVIGIVGLLATLTILSLENTRKLARDTKRVADMATIEKALAMYFNDNGGYPPIQNCRSYYSTTATYRTYGIYWNNPCPTASLRCYLANYLTILPVDPVQSDVYAYYYSSNPGDNNMSYGIMVRPESSKYIALAANTNDGGAYTAWLESGTQPRYCHTTYGTGTSGNWLLYLVGSCPLHPNEKCCGGP